MTEIKEENQNKEISKNFNQLLIENKNLLEELKRAKKQKEDYFNASLVNDSRMHDLFCINDIVHVFSVIQLEGEFTWETSNINFIGIQSLMSEFRLYLIEKYNKEIGEKAA